MKPVKKTENGNTTINLKDLNLCAKVKVKGCKILNSDRICLWKVV